MPWANWIVTLLSALPTAANLQEKLTACNAEKDSLIDEIARIKDDKRIDKQKVTALEREVDQLRPCTLDTADESVLCMIAGDEDDYVAPETIAERFHVNRHEIHLRLEALADGNYLKFHQGEYALTRKARVYLRQVGALSQLSKTE